MASTIRDQSTNAMASKCNGASQSVFLYTHDTDMVKTGTRKRNRRLCSKSGCVKIDAGGGFCTRHGGGPKCKANNCTKGAQAGGYCRTHGGGAKCRASNCNKVDAGRGYCRAHGGGKRCQYPECTKSDIGGGFCSAHGGGRKCTEPGCEKTSQGRGKCWVHGHRRRCNQSGCQRTVRAPLRRFCKLHEVSSENKDITEEPGTTQDSLTGKEKESAGNLRQSFAAVELDTNLTSKEMDGSSVALSSSEDNVSPPSIQSISPVWSVSESTRLLGLVMDVDQSNNSTVLAASESVIPKAHGRLPSNPPPINHARPEMLTPMQRKTLEQKAPSSRNSARDQFVSDDITLRRIVISVTSPIRLDKTLVKSMLKGIEGVRSVHTEPEDFTENTFSFVLYTDASLKVSAVTDMFGWTHASCEVESATKLSWLRKRVIYELLPGDVADSNMSDIMTAVRTILSVTFVQLHTDLRRLTVEGCMSLQSLDSALSGYGFNCKLVYVQALPLCYTFHLDDANRLYVAADGIRTSLAEVEGVQNILLLPKRKEVIVEAFVQDDASLIQHVKAKGFKTAYVSRSGDTPQVLSTSSYPTCSAATEFGACGSDLNYMNDLSDLVDELAGETAYAVGWSAPGCAKNYGGKCDCGDDCRCIGCKVHNNPVLRRYHSLE